MIKKQDRDTSIEIMKLAQMPLYNDRIMSSMKENLLVNSKSNVELDGRKGKTTGGQRLERNWQMLY